MWSSYCDRVLPYETPRSASPKWTNTVRAMKWNRNKTVLKQFRNCFETVSKLFRFRLISCCADSLNQNYSECTKSRHAGATLTQVYRRAWAMQVTYNVVIDVFDGCKAEHWAKRNRRRHKSQRCDPRYQLTNNHALLFFCCCYYYYYYVKNLWCSHNYRYNNPTINTNPNTTAAHNTKTWSVKLHLNGQMENEHVRFSVCPIVRGQTNNRTNTRGANPVFTRLQVALNPHRMTPFLLRPNKSAPLLK